MFELPQWAKDAVRGSGDGMWDLGPGLVKDAVWLSQWDQVGLLSKGFSAVTGGPDTYGDFVNGFGDTVDGWKAGLDEWGGGCQNTTAYNVPYWGTTAAGMLLGAGEARAAAFGARIVEKGVVKTGVTGTISKGSAKAVSSTTRVGRWMSPEEYQKMVNEGLVQWNEVGVHRVANPADRTTHRAAPTGDVYVEYDVPTSALRPHSNGTLVIAGPDSLFAKLPGRATGPDVPATNIVIQR